MNHRLSLILFLVLVVGCGLLIGAVFTPGAWYAGLAKPAFNPPGWVFGPAWTFLYVLIALAGWRIWRRDRGGMAMKLWWAQLALNFGWTPVFFGAREIGLALLVILLLLATIIAFIVAARLTDRVAPWLFVPYLAWVDFAALLNTAIFVLN